MLSTCQGVMRNRDDRPRANGERWGNIFVLLSEYILCFVVINAGKISPAYMHHQIERVGPGKIYDFIWGF